MGAHRPPESVTLVQAIVNPPVLGRYLPAVQLRLLTAAAGGCTLLAGTLVYADVSGFTRLTERLSHSGTEGSEQLLDVIDGSFCALLEDAAAVGGELLKFGGDALLLWFEGPEHAERACAAALAMRSTLRRIGTVRAGVSTVVLRMSVGVHSGEHRFFLVGDRHRELVVAGPASSAVVAMEKAAGTGQVLLSQATAARLRPRCLGPASGPGTLLARAPALVRTHGPSAERPPEVSPEDLAGCFAAPLRAHLEREQASAEHRTAAVGFVRFGGFDALVRDSPQDAAAALDELVSAAQAAAEEYEVCLLGSDIAADGGKLLLSAGAPRSLGDDEERLLLVLRQVIEHDSRLAVSAGAARGQVFAAEVGIPRRRAYTLMGDTVNVAARLMAAAPPGHLYATAEVLSRLRTGFELTALAPLALKGKRRPLPAWDVGPRTRVVPLTGARRRPRLVGRERELVAIEAGLRAAEAGHGSLIEIVGETGSGKSRLLTEARQRAGPLRLLHATCETYTRQTAYAGASHVYRQMLGLRADDDDATVLERLRAEVKRRKPELAAWLPLIAMSFGVSVSFTPEIEQLADDARAAKLMEVVTAFLGHELGVPSLLAIEHAHLMDAGSAMLLSGVARAVATTAWLIVLTRRDVPGGFTPPPPYTRLELGPLSPEQALELAMSTPEAERVPPHVMELAVRRAAGSPEFLLDLLAAAASGEREALPASVSAAAAARLDTLDPGDRRLVCRTAVLGLSFDADRAGDVLDPDEPPPTPADWQRLAAVFAHDPEGRVRFKRPALREAAYARLPFKLRRELHGRLARALEAEGDRIDPAVLSEHWLDAGAPERAYEHALIAAQRARRQFSHADAAALYRRALQAGRAAGLERTADDRRRLAEAWEELGDALRSMGEPEAAMRALTEARRRMGGDPVALARLCHRHAEVADRSQSLTAAVRWLTRGLRQLEGIDGPEATAWRARLQAFLGGVRNRQGRWDEAAAACRRAIAEAERVGELRALARACYTLDWALVGAGQPQLAEHSARALAIYAQLGEPEHEMTVLNNLGMFAYYDGLWDDAVRLYERAAQASRRAGRPSDLAFTDCNIGEIRSDQGRYAEAAEHLERARRLWSATGDRQSAAYAKLLLGRLATRRGEHETAVPLLSGAREQLRRFRLDAYAGFATLLVAEAEAFGGDPAAAIRILGEELLGRPDVGEAEAAARRLLAVALARQGRLPAAAGELERSLACARAGGLDYDLAAGLDLLERLGQAGFPELREREEILARLRIEALPAPALPRRRRSPRPAAARSA